MNTHKIIEFNSDSSSVFFQFLKWFSEKKSWGWQFETCAEFSWQQLQGATAAMVAPSFSEQILPQVQTQPSLVRSLECFDSFFWEEESWYPRIIKHEVIRQLLISSARDLDIRSPAFVVGFGAEIRIAASVLSQLGFREIVLVGDMNDISHQKKILARSFLGVHFELLDSEHLTLQALSASIIINTWDLSQHEALLTDLSYFNFMKENGYVLDLFSMSQDNVFLQEAQSAHLRVLSPSTYGAYETFLWLARLKAGEEISLGKLNEAWEDYRQENCS